MGFLARFQEWREQRRVRRSAALHIRQLEQKLKRVEAERKRSLAVFEMAKHEADEDRKRYDASLARLKEAAEQGAAVAKKQSEALSAMQEQLKTANDLVIPALVAGHQLILHRFEEDSKVIAMRMGALAAAQNSGP